MNVSNLELILVQKISNSTSTLDTLIYSKALQELKTGTVTVVNTTADLPNPNTAFIGHLFYEKTTEAMYTVDSLGYARKITTENTNALFAWGSNLGGKLGDGSITSRSSPVTVAGGGTTWCAVSAGGAAVKTDGTLWTWGCNGSGRLGDGTITNRSSPGTVAGGGNTWCAVSAGGYFSAAIKTDGTLWTWGANTRGQLGDGTTTARCSPGTVAGGGATWCASSALECMTAAIKTDGTLWTWGANLSGQLGEGSTTSRSSPGTVAGGGTNWCVVSISGQSSAAIKTDGTLWTWGRNQFGQLGDGTATNRSSPGTVSGGGSTWCAVSTGYGHIAAIKTDGTLWTWGANQFGQLGDGTFTSRSSPGWTVGAGTTWCAISNGGCSSVAIKTDGTVWTWGRNTCGQLGDGTTATRMSPASIILPFSWKSISTDGDSTFGLYNLSGG